VLFRGTGTFLYVPPGKYRSGPIELFSNMTPEVAFHSETSTNLFNSERCGWSAPAHVSNDGLY
jgi:hypothetical protein